MIDFHLLNTLQKLAMKREITLFSSDRWFTSKCRSFIADSKSSVSIFVRRHFRVNFNASYIREKFTNNFTWFFPTYLKKRSNNTGNFQGQMFNRFIRKMLALIWISKKFNGRVRKMNNSIWCCHLKRKTSLL
jgi:hypothetical protein